MAVTAPGRAWILLVVRIGFIVDLCNESLAFFAQKHWIAILALIVPSGHRKYTPLLNRYGVTTRAIGVPMMMAEILRAFELYRFL